MSVAHVDASVPTAIAFDEPDRAAYTPPPDEFARLISSSLLR